MIDILPTETFRLIFAAIGFFTLLFIMFYINKGVFIILKRKAAKTENKIDDFILDLFRIPGLALIYWITSGLFTHFFFNDLIFSSYLKHFNSLLIIAIVAWICLKFTKLLTFQIKRKLDISVADNLNARKNLTQINVFRSIVNTIIIIIAIAVALMTFEKARGIGAGLLTSAGVMGIIVGLAAQKSIGMILSGIQIAITQPIRLDDVVVVEGEWGRIEEISLTYVVVKIWDERRLILPVSYFLEKPFQNWTRTSASVLGTVFINVDYSFPVDELRKALQLMVEDDENWDKRVANIQVTNALQYYKEIRILVSSSDSSKNWNLRVSVREKALNFIQENYPDTFVKIRVKQETEKSLV